MVVGSAVVYIPYYTIVTTENLPNNVQNSAAYVVYVTLLCRPSHSLPLGSSRRSQCIETCQQNLIGIIVAAFIPGIALVFLMLALNITGAVGTINGILFYTNNIIVALNAGMYLPFKTSNFITVFIFNFISWLNLDIDFDACFHTNYVYCDGLDQVYKYKALL